MLSDNDLAMILDLVAFSRSTDCPNLPRTPEAPYEVLKAWRKQLAEYQFRKESNAPSE